MKPLNTMATAALAVIAVLALGACQKKKTSSAASTPAASACVYNQAYGTYTLAGTTTPCNPSTMNQVCPAAPNNYYTTVTGQIVTCTPGTALPAGAYAGQYNNNQNLGQYQNQGYGCDAYYYQYGIQYVPVVISGQLQCMRADLLNQYTQGTPYYDDYSYHYNYPLQGYYNGNQTCVSVGYGGLNLGGCF